MAIFITSQDFPLTSEQHHKLSPRNSRNGRARGLPGDVNERHVYGECETDIAQGLAGSLPEALSHRAHEVHDCYAAGVLCWTTLR